MCFHVFHLPPQPGCFSLICLLNVCVCTPHNSHVTPRSSSNSRLYTKRKFNHVYMNRLMGKPTMWFPNKSNTNRPVQLQKQARSLKLWSSVEKELYYWSSENKGADQLRGYREADLRLCFRLCRLFVFPWGGSYMTNPVLMIADQVQHRPQIVNVQS